MFEPGSHFDFKILSSWVFFSVDIQAWMEMHPQLLANLCAANSTDQLQGSMTTA